VQKAAAAPKPPPSTLPPQQAWPTPPQGVLVTVSTHELVLAEQVPLTPVASHAWPTAMQVRVEKRPPSGVTGTQQPLSLQELPPQQGSPGAPQAVLDPPLPPVLLTLASIPPPAPPEAVPTPPAPPEPPKPAGPVPPPVP
jgi:hypothetical protein